MRALAAWLLFLPTLPAAISNPRVVGTTATQAILSWTAPDASVCVVDLVSTEPVTARAFSATGDGAAVTVTLANHGLIAGQGVYLSGSPWDGWQTVATVADANTFTFASPSAGTGTGSLHLPVDDVHAGLFAGANQDSRASGLGWGRNRLFVAGKRAAEMASDGRYHSRALEAYTSHLYRITCGSDTATGTFTTSNIPLGGTYNDPLPVDPNAPGKYAWPEFSPTDRNTTVIDPQSGMLIKPILFAGDVYVQPYGLTFDTARNQGGALCADGAWTTPCAAVNGADGNANASVGNSSAWLVIRPNLLAWSGYSWDPVDTMAPEIDSIRLDIKGSGTAAADALRQIDLCLSTDGGQTCATPIQSGIQLSQDTGNPPAGTIVRFGSWTPGTVDTWLWAATPRITRSNIYTRTGGVTISGTTVNWSSGNYFNADILKPGAPVRLSTISTADACSSGAEFTIASVGSGTQLTLSSAPGAAYTYYCAPNFAVMIRRSNLDAASQINIENVTADAVFSSLGHFAANGAKKIFGKNQFFGGYMGFLQMGGMGSTLIWINPSTGETRAIGVNRMNAKTNGPDRWDYSLCAGDTAVIDDTKADNLTWYCVATDKATSKTIILRARFLGPASGVQINSNSVGIGTGCTEPDQWTVACSNVVIQNLTPVSAGASVPDQVAAFDPLYNGAKCKNWVPYASPSGRLTIGCTYGGQETLGWTAIFDPGDASPAHAGQAGGPRILSAMNTWSSPGARWGVWHTTTDSGDMDWQSVGINNASGGSSLGAGPWVVQTTSPITGTPFDDCALYGNPLGVSGPQCSQWTITKLDANANPDPVNGSPEPYDPTPAAGETKAPGFLQSAQPGDILCVGGTTLSNSCNPNSGNELVKLLAKNGNVWVVERQLTAAPLKTYPTGATKYLYMTVNNLRIPQPLSYTSAGGGVVWNYVTDPHGLAAQRDPYNYGDHAFIKPGMNTQVRNSCWGNLPCYSTRYGTYPDLFSIPDTIFTARTAAFSGIYGHSDIDGSNVESHAGPPPAKGSGAQRQNYYDGRPVIQINNLTWTKVNGTQQIYKFNTGTATDPDNLGSGITAFNRKAIATHAACGARALKDVSRPNSPFTDGAGASYTYCVPRANGECYPGSLLGEVYVNCPLIDHPDCYGQTASIEDLGGPVSDICVGNQHSYANAVLEASASRTDRYGQAARILSTLSGKNKLNYPYFSSVALPDGSWVIWKWWRMGDWRSYDVMGKLPPFPPMDSTNRGDFVTVNLKVGSVPQGAQTVTVQFGYAENGAPGDFRCTTRQEGCVKGSQAGDDYGFAGDTVTGVACAAGCTVGVPAIPQRVLYYRYQYRDGSNAVLATSGMQALAVP